jgi:GT2 family glycosyltransferase
LLLDYLYAYFNTDPTHARFLASCNLSIPRERFARLGGFDVSFPSAAAEDRDFCDRWLNEGGRIAFVPDVVVHHHHDLDLSRFWYQHAAYGRGAYRFHRQRADRGSGRIRVEPWRFYSGLVLHPFKIGARRPASLAALLLVSQVANVCGYLLEATSRIRLRQPPP